MRFRGMTTGQTLTVGGVLVLLAGAGTALLVSRVSKTGTLRLVSQASFGENAPAGNADVKLVGGTLYSSIAGNAPVALAHTGDAPTAHVASHAPAGNDPLTWVHKKNVIFTTAFPGAALPSDWTQTGTSFTTSGTFGLVMSGTGGASGAARVTQNNPSAAENTQMSVQFILPVTGVGEIALCKYDAYATTNCSLFASLDVKGSQLRFWKKSSSAWAPTGTALSVATTPGLTAGRRYQLTLTKVNPNWHTLSLTDTATSVTVSTNASNSGTGMNPDSVGCGFGDGNPGIANLSVDAMASFFIERFTFSSGAPDRPRVVVFGDSITEYGGVGEFTFGGDTGGYRYAKLLSNALNGSVVISGQSQATPETVLERLAADLNGYNGDFVLTCIGTNGGTPIGNESVADATFRGIQSIRTGILQAGAIPIIGTIIPRTNTAASNDVRNPSNQTVNALIRSQGWLVVDFAKAIANGHDLTAAANAALMDSDGVHPNQLGHAAMYAQIVGDAPYLFMGNRQLIRGAGAAGNVAAFSGNGYTLASGPLAFSGGSVSLNGSITQTFTESIQNTVRSNAPTGGYATASYMAEVVPDYGAYRGAGYFSMMHKGRIDNGGAGATWFAGAAKGGEGYAICGVSGNTPSSVVAQTSYATLWMEPNTKRTGVGGVTAPTAYLHLHAGNTPAGDAPLKIDPGPLTTVPENNAIEYDGTYLYIVVSGVRKRFLMENAP